MAAIEGKENITLFRLMVLRTALQAEILGMRKHGQSAYAIVKKEFKLKGDKNKVFEQFDKIVEEMKPELIKQRKY